DDDVDPAGGKPGQRLRHGLRQREVHRHVGVTEIARLDLPVAIQAVHDPCHLHAVLARQRLDEPPHPPVPHDQQARHLVPATDRSTGYGAKKVPSIRVSAAGTSVSSMTNVMFRRDAACDTSLSGTSPSAAST